MPRTGKGGGGPEARSMGTASAAGRTYGEPSPDIQTPQPPNIEGGRPPGTGLGPEGGIAPEGGPPGMPQGMAGGPSMVPGDLMGMAGQSMRPDEPITSGIDSGPGAGSGSLASNPRRTGGRNLIRIAEETGDPFLLELAERARGRMP